MNQLPNGHEFEFLKLKPSQIRVDKDYQRPLDNLRVNKIVKDFNGDIFNAPKVSYRDGEYWCFDGQQSTAVWNTLHNNSDEPLECKVFYGMTWEDECNAFIAQNGFSKDVATLWKMRAAYNRGDFDMINMVDILESCGYYIRLMSKRNSGFEIKAVGAIRKCYNELGSEAFTDMMSVLMEAWGGDPDSVTQQILNGMRIFYKTYYGMFTHDALVTSLKRVLPSDILRHGRSHNSHNYNPYTREIVIAYNHARRHRLDESKFM